MKRILILYATRQGQTAKIAERIGKHLAEAGATVLLCNAADKATQASLDLDAFDLLVFGASMHAGGLEKELTRFIKSHRDEIATKKRSFFLVLMSAATKDPVRRAASLADALAKMNARIEVPFDDLEMIAGALMYTKYPLPIKWIMRHIAKQEGGSTDTSTDHEYTDWEQVRRYAERLGGL